MALKNRIADPQEPPEVRRVRILRRETWDAVDLPGDVVQREAGEAARLTLLGYATALDWTPSTAELQAAAEVQFVVLERARESRGLSLPAWLAAPGIRKQYQTIHKTLGGE